MLTLDGWVEPKQSLICDWCGQKYEVTGVFDIREATGYCPFCESERTLCKKCGVVLDTKEEENIGLCEVCMEV